MPEGIIAMITLNHKEKVSFFCSDVFRFVIAIATATPWSQFWPRFQPAALPTFSLRAFLKV